jgi:hypothetical protein
MEKKIDTLWQWCDRSLQICDELKECLESERRSLIQLDMDKITEEVSRKQMISSELAKTRQELKTLLVDIWGTSSIEDIAKKSEASVFLALWREKEKTWTEKWEMVREATEYNQRFLRHSIKNLGQLMENFRRLLGEQIRYSPSGKPVDSEGSGKYIQKRY